MADLSELLGTILTSLVHARRIADEESAAIAEYYKDHPLLQGMSLPRVRVPEMTLDIPILIESQDEGENNELEDIDTLIEHLKKELNDSLREENVEIPNEIKKQFLQHAKRRITRLLPHSKNVKRPPREIVVRAIDVAFNTVFKKSKAIQVTPTQAQNILSDMRKAASNYALKKEGDPPKLNASIITNEIKDRTQPGSVSRLHITLKEEGLEWSTSEQSDGSRSTKLTPE